MEYLVISVSSPKTVRKQTNLVQHFVNKNRASNRPYILPPPPAEHPLYNCTVSYENNKAPSGEFTLIAALL